MPASADQSSRGHQPPAEVEDENWEESKPRCHWTAQVLAGVYQYFPIKKNS
jgi:hypothetical protein